MIRRFETEYDLSSSIIEEVALATSRELYDNAETGNIHTGDMKLAYDWWVFPSLKYIVYINADPQSIYSRFFRGYSERTILHRSDLSLGIFLLTFSYSLPNSTRQKQAELDPQSHIDIRRCV